MGAEDPTSPQRSVDSNSNRYPVPDPTVLTTQQLHRELLALREILEARLNGMDKALSLLQAAVDRSPSIPEIFAQFTEKFNSVETQFSERDIRTEQTSRDSKVAVDAALQAAKEAVSEQNKSSAIAIAKSEASTTKQMDQIGLIIQTMTTAFNDKVNDIKDRLTLIQGHSRGTGDMAGYIVGAIGLVIAIATLIVRYNAK